MRAVSACFPDSMKRLILLSSLIAYVINQKDSECELVKNMDATLRLTQSTQGDSLRFGFRISKLFWGDRDVFKHELCVLTSDADREQKTKAAERMVKYIPPWFGYNDKQLLAKEIGLYFSQNTIQHA